MNKHFLTGVVLVFFICVPVLAAAVETPPVTFSETLPQSAFQNGDANAAVRMLLKANVPVPAIMKAALENGVSHDALVGALLAARISPEKVVLHCLQGPMPFQSALAALKNHGVRPAVVLVWLVKGETGIAGIYDTCDFMLKNGYSQADILTILKDAGADRELVIQVVRWFEIPPATVIAVYQSLLDYFGHVFNRHALPQPALLSIGVARITIEDQGRPVISPMKP